MSTTSTPEEVEEINNTTTVILKSHALYCFDIIYSKLNRSILNSPEFDGSLEYPLFVTWNIISKNSGNKRLRGCIGNFEANPIGQGLKEYAAISAFKDTRFDPISSKELPRLSCGVSLLTNFELCENYLDWSIDKHGIYIQLPNPLLSPHYPSTSLPLTTLTHSTRPSFRSISLLPKYPSLNLSNPKHLKQILTATYLPDVAKEQGWNKIQTIDSCIEKSGWKGKIGEEIRRSCRIFRYQSEKIEVDYREWLDWKESRE